MKKILLLGSVTTSTPPLKHGGTEWVVYFQAKNLARFGVKIILVSYLSSKKNFIQALNNEGEKKIDLILRNIEFIELGNESDKGQLSKEGSQKEILTESSRKLRIEINYLAQVEEILIKREKEYEVILNNMRGGESIFVPIANFLNKTLISVLHLNLFPELITILKRPNVFVIPLSNHQRLDFPEINYLETIPNPTSPAIFKFNPTPKNYALYISTIGYHKNQKDAILACKKASIPLIISGKIRDKDYFNKEIKPYIDNKEVIYYKELDLNKKIKLYQEAKVFLFPIKWQEPFGLVVIESLMSGTPVIAYPNGGPSEIIKNGVNGFLVKNYQEMAEKIKKIDQIERKNCRLYAERNFSDEIVGNKYFQVLKKFLS